MRVWDAQAIGGVVSIGSYGWSSMNVQVDQCVFTGNAVSHAKIVSASACSLLLGQGTIPGAGMCSITLEYDLKDAAALLLQRSR